MKPYIPFSDAVGETIVEIDYFGGAVIVVFEDAFSFLVAIDEYGDPVIDYRDPGCLAKTDFDLVGLGICTQAEWEEIVADHRKLEEVQRRERELNELRRLKEKYE